MTAHADYRDNHGTLKSGFLAFRQWRRTRPFWAGVFTLLAALVVMYPPYASLKFGDIVISLHTVGGISALVIGVVLIACAASFWLRPEFRLTGGVVTLLLSVVAIVTANFGSFLIGTTLGLIGASLAIAWSPKEKQKRTGAEPARSGGHGAGTGTTGSGTAGRHGTPRPGRGTGRADEPVGSVHGGEG